MGKRRVLLVDDNPGVLRALVRYFAHPGVELHTADGCREGLERIASETWDAFSFDLELPDGQGWSLVEAARARFPDAVIVVLTAYDSEQGAARAAEHRALYLIKPNLAAARDALV